MRWANKQSVPASTLIDTEGVKVLAGNLTQETGKRPHEVSVTIILSCSSSTCKFLNV